MIAETVQRSIVGDASTSGVECALRLALARITEQSDRLIASAPPDDPMRLRLEDIKRDALNAATMLASTPTVALSRAMDSIEDPVALFDETGLLLFANQAYRALLEPALSGAVLGGSYAEIHDAWRELAFSDAAQRATFIERPRYGGDPPARSEVLTRDGRTLRIVARPTPDGGIVEIIWDQTEEARLLAELREARLSAESASAAKSEFLSTMSHELRTPLNAVLGFAQLLQRNAASLAERHRKHVDQILRAGEHVLRLVDDVLDLSRIETGHVPIRPESIDVFGVLTEVMTALEATANAKGVRIELAANTEKAPAIFADRTRFSQIIMNFGSNALKYNRPGGSATFAVSHDRGFVRVTVSDVGVGIPADKQAKIFRPFERAGQEMGSIEGTGIGLVIAQRLAERMGGTVGFRSVFQEGSEFWVEMPINGRAKRASAESGIRPAFRPDKDETPNDP